MTISMVPSRPITSEHHPRFPHIFRPFQIKGVTLHNRIAVSGHFAGWWVDRGLPSDAFVAYLEERARGGVGLFVIGATSPMPGSGWLENLDDAIIPRYRALVDAGHRHGTKVFAQLCHPGSGPLPGRPIYLEPRTAAGTQPRYRPPARVEPTADELRTIVAAFGRAAGRAIVGGVDGVEVHAHESFLHAQMLNPLWNRRADEYGGALENRMRFLVETLMAMRAAIGSEPPLGVRLKLDDMAQRGMSAEEYHEVVRHLEQRGLVDYVSVTGGDGRFHHGPMARPEGEWLPLVRDLRAGTRLPLMHAGRISTPEMAEQALAEGWLDVAIMNRTHIADPHFTRKVFEDRLDDIRFCTRCLQSCHGKISQMTCIYNPVTSRELAWAELTPAVQPGRVVVVGAGPAGMEAALTAARRGHAVVVLEQAERVGGQVWAASASPLRRPFARIAEFYERQARKGSFEVRLGVAATPEMVLALEPDAVVIATGSRPNRIEIPGGPQPSTVHDVVAGAVDGAHHVVILDREGFNRPMVAADYLSSRGVQVDFVTPFLSVGPTVEVMTLDEMLVQLAERGVRFWPGHELEGWEGERRIRIRDVQTAEERTIEEVDAVVAAAGSTAVSDLARALRGAVPRLYVVGDANTPQTVESATYQGARIGREI